MENRNIYKGHRYVPKIMGEWDKQEQYEGLSIVTHQGTSYTSKKSVPVGVDILNEEYWVVTGNYNAQVEHYRQDVRDMQDEVNSKANQDYVDNELNSVNQQLAQIATNVKSHGVVGNGLEDETEIIQQVLDNTSGEIIFPDGEYLISRVTLPSNVHIKASKKARFIANVADEYGIIFIPDESENIVWEGGIMDGNFRNFPNSNRIQNMFFEPRGKNITIKNCVFDDLTGSAVASSTGRNIKFLDSVVNIFRDHVFYFSTNANNLLAENIISYSKGLDASSAYKFRKGASNVIVNNCKNYNGGAFATIESQHIWDNESNIIGGDCINFTFNDCYSEVSTLTVYFYGDEGRTNQNIEFNNCIFQSLKTNNILDALQLRFGEAGIRNVTFKDCIFNDTNGRILAMGTETAKVENAKIIGCVVNTLDGINSRITQIKNADVLFDSVVFNVSDGSDAHMFFQGNSNANIINCTFNGITGNVFRIYADTMLNSVIRVDGVRASMTGATIRVTEGEYPTNNKGLFIINNSEFSRSIGIINEGLPINLFLLKNNRYIDSEGNLIPDFSDTILRASNGSLFRLAVTTDGTLVAQDIS